MHELKVAIRANLTDDLRRPEYRGDPNLVTGQCYVASEALLHLAGGKQAGLKAVRVRHEGTTHWWVRDTLGVDHDITASQFMTPVPYNKGIPTGFLTKAPSKRAQELINRVRG
jgi:hypothetical protein